MTRRKFVAEKVRLETAVAAITAKVAEPSRWLDAPPPAPFRDSASRGGLSDAQREVNAARGLGHRSRGGGRFGSFPLHDRYDDESGAE